MKTLDLVKRCLSRAFVLGGVLLTIAMSVPVAPAFATDAASGQTTALEQNQKTATELDENLETKVTLSFPGKREAEPADVVFVLDKSGASAQKDIYKFAPLPTCHSSLSKLK